MLDEIVPNTSIRYTRVGKNAQLLHEISIDEVNGFQTQIDNLNRSQNLTIGGGYERINTLGVSKVGNITQETVSNKMLPEVELTVLPSIPTQVKDLDNVGKAIDDGSGNKEVLKGIAIIVVLLTVITLIAIFK